MPAAALSWGVLMTIAEPAMRRAAGVQLVEIDHLETELGAALIFVLFVGGLMQLCIGWPTARYLRVRKRSASAYFQMGAIVASLLIAVLLAGALLDGAPVEQLHGFDVLLAASVTMLSVFVCYGILGVIEHPCAPPTNGGQ